MLFGVRTMVRRTLIALFVCSFPASAQQASTDAAKLTIDRIFASEEYRSDPVPEVKWLSGGAYTTTRPSATRPGGTEIIRIVGTGKIEVLDIAAKMVLGGVREPHL